MASGSLPLDDHQGLYSSAEIPSCPAVPGVASAA
jgi:hypothetical protein